jgi:hypothetical protein
MKFSHEYSKLKKTEFTTIRQNKRFYKEKQTVFCDTPKQQFSAFITKIERIKKKDITEELAQSDADCSRADLIQMLVDWYGPVYDNFIVIHFSVWEKTRRQKAEVKNAAEKENNIQQNN